MELTDDIPLKNNPLEYESSSEEEAYFHLKRLQHAIRRATYTLNKPAEFVPLLTHVSDVVIKTLPNFAQAAIYIPPLSKAASAINIPVPANLGINVGGNMLAAAARIIAGLNLILDEDDYRQTQNKVKGVISIVAGVQAIVLSYNPAVELALGIGAGGFAAPAFAFITLCDLVNASIDFYNANKEVNIKGWLEERVKEINYIDNRITKLKKELDSKLDFLQSKGTAGEKLTDDILKKIVELNEKKQTLVDDFITRSKVYCHGNGEFTTITGIAAYEKRCDFVVKMKDSINDNSKIHLSQILTADLTTEDGKRDKEIQDKLTEDYKDKRIHLIMKGLSFTAMTLFAIAPFAGPAAPALIIPAMVISTFIAGYYIYQHREKIANTFQAGKKFSTEKINQVLDKFHDKFKDHKHIDGDIEEKVIKPCNKPKREEIQVRGGIENSADTQRALSPRYKP